MKEIKHPVDDFFKEALQEHQIQPSDAGRQRFLDEAATIDINGKRSRSRWLLLLGGIIVTTSVALIFWFSDGEQSTVGSEQSTVGSEQLAVGSEQSAVGSGQLAVGSEQLAVGSEQLAVGSGQLEVGSEQLAVGSEQLAVGSVEVLESGSSIPSNRGDSTNVTEPSVLPDTAIVTTQMNLPKEDTILMTELTSIPEKKKKKKNSSDWQFATSVYYSPEWMFNTLEGDKFVSNFGIEESFRYGRYILRTGIGLSIAKGTNELMVEFNDYLGTFNQLDSIGFNWDERNYHLLPTYYTTSKDVWDSLLQLDYPKVIKRYTYLQIPLVLGYDVLQTKHVSLGFRAGPILSILMESKQLSNEYDPGKNKIIRINQVTPDRIQTNWQLMGGINLSLHLSKRFDFELEPNIKYYFNSVYEKSDATKKPWSVGFRACFSIRY